MAYKIIDIQGIGEAYAPKLIAIGIKLRMSCLRLA